MELRVKLRLIGAALAAVVFASGSGVALAQAAQAPKPQAAPSQAAVDQAIEQLRKDARTDINTLIQASMQFTSDEAAKFWPLYKTYEQTRKGLTDDRLAIIKEYAKNYSAMTDAKALELMQRGLALEERTAAGKRAFLAELQKALPAKQVARFYQVHTRIDMLIDAMFAGEVPLVK
jgi:hypothetical protein